jgi:hypothetical protein
LVGGGAHWPFVKEWAWEAVGEEKVYVGEYPEEAIARGLPSAFVKKGRSETLPPPSSCTQSPPPSSSPSPTSKLVASISASKAFWLELLGGLFGLMGMGWFFVLESVTFGCLGLIGWWVVLAIVIAGSGIFSIASLTPLPLIIVVIAWLVGPLLSASLAYLTAREK